MSTQPPFQVPAGTPTIPLSDAAKAAYQDLYDKMEAAIEGTTDPAVLGALNDAQSQVDDVLTRDGMYRLEQNTALFDALLQQIGETNTGLRTLQAQITAIATHFKQAGEILATIDKVLTLVASA